MAKKKRFLGLSFPDEVAKVTLKKGFKKSVDDDWKETLLPNFDYTGEQVASRSFWRTAAFSTFCLGLFFIISLRLFHLQIVSGRHNRELADGNRIQIRLIHAPRGVIFDRNGKILAANSPAFRLLDKNTNKTRLISREEALELEVKNDPRSQGLEVDNVRNYPMAEKDAHIVGYVGEISKEELKLPEYRDYRLGDRIGKSGIEAQYESLLKGVDGGEIIEVDSLGQKVRVLRTNQPKNGKNIYLTIDATLQDKIYQLMKDTLMKVGSCCSAAVAGDPTNGQILALLSFPSFDPNIFTKSGDEGLISEILTRADFPILNRSIAGTYPPGSTFKIVSSLAVLTSGKITPDTIFLDNGVIYLGTFRFTNWYFNEYGRVEGPVNLLKAIQRSNDTYFYQASQIIGEKALADWARKLKLGGKLGIDIPGEVSGLIPDDAWKRKIFGEGWYPGDTLHMAIGQGFVLTTPLQILGITSYIANDGTLYNPQLLAKVVEGNVAISEFKPKVLVSNLLPPDKIKLVKDGLKLVPKYGGTAWPFFTFPLETAGKTGTAEYGDPKSRTHAWYTSFAPAADPKIALTILVEGGGEGSNVSAPIAKEVYRWYFSADKNKPLQDVYNQATDSGRTLGE